MQTAVFSDGNERHSRTWRITAHFSLSEHSMIYDSRLRYLPDYIGSILTSRLRLMQTIQNSMKSITLLSFSYPRQFRGNADVPVNVILHFSNSIGFLTIQALLNTIGITVTCTPVDFGREALSRCYIAPHLYSLFTYEFKRHGPCCESEFICPC